MSLTSIDRMHDLRRASKIMGCAGIDSEAIFVKRALEWLAKKHGDVRLESLRHAGWKVTCHYLGKLDEWEHGNMPANTQAEALANAIIESEGA